MKIITSLIFFKLNAKIINAFEIQEELKYCKDISRIDFFNSCIMSIMRFYFNDLEMSFKFKDIVIFNNDGKKIEGEVLDVSSDHVLVG